MIDVRKIAYDFLDQVKAGVVVTSNGSTESLFTIMTGMTHSGLQTTWAKEDEPKKARRDKGNFNYFGLNTTTSCNGLTGKVGHKIGSPVALGVFEPEQVLNKAGLMDAWVPANSGQRPKCGDVFRSKKYHVGVSFEFIGDQWVTIEAGQGGPGHDYKNACDKVLRKQVPWNPSDLRGWVDIEILMQLAKKSPPWLVGWWQFETNQKKQYVWLPKRGRAQAFDIPPPNFLNAPAENQGTKGELAFDDDSQGTTITWPGTSEPDMLRHLPNVDYMLGYRGATQLQAVKLPGVKGKK